MFLLFLAFFSGVLTILAPCVLPVLPVIVSSSWQSKNWRRPLLIISSLAASIILFTLLLKASTLLIDIPSEVWTTISGALILGFGIITIWPDLWDKISHILKLQKKSDTLLYQAGGVQKGTWSAILIGAALGPVFSSCSPTYAIILATVLPESFAMGLLYLFAYALGLALVLLLIAIFGQKLVSKLGWLADANGWFKKILGIILIVIGIMIITGLEKKFETYLLDQGIFKSIRIENTLLENYEK